uniref:Uncharacterized protein n=1 Tax=Siphoviridae sp. ctwfx1 TaxID=2825732 RepID=A0A8S5UVF4_9CAUD|nr:MAG TPA: hypothetical protein [Siphoviridae sp. ctwfx1]
MKSETRATKETRSASAEIASAIFERRSLPSVSLAASSAARPLSEIA